MTGPSPKPQHTDPQGSLWRRWDPHVHAPGTVLNDQYTGPTAWDDFLGKIEASAPGIAALGITDYLSIELYQQVVAHKASGRLANVEFIFPNIEMRYGIGTMKGSAINVHLLVNPADPNHVAEITRALRGITFEAYQDTFHCDREDLIRLGKAHDKSIQDERAALAAGTNQFKVEPGQLKKLWQGSAWVRDNVLIAVSASNHDGTAGIQDSSFTALRKEIERQAHIIFSGNPKDREFWLGQGVLSVERIQADYGACKPCLHGSDAHSAPRVGSPDGHRFCWLKGDLNFETLVQASIDPSNRASIGEAAPVSASPSQAISVFYAEDAPWLTVPVLDLNPGLVAIIGARGSGKTALADMIAAGADALPEEDNPQSFMARAADYLTEAAVALKWGDGDTEVRPLDPDRRRTDKAPRARYLSQQFVEDLCSSAGMTDTLLREVERVVFDSHSVSDRDGAVDFEDLREMRATRYRQARDREEDAVAGVSERIGTELEKTKLVDGYKNQVADKQKLIDQARADRAKLISKGSEERLKRLQELTEAAETVRSYVRHYNLQEQELLSIRDEVTNVRTNWAPEDLRETASRHGAAGIKEGDWDPFKLDYSGPVDDILTERLAKSRKSMASWKGEPPPAQGAGTPYVPDDADLSRQPLAKLEAEIGRLQQLVSVDRNTATRFAALSKKIVDESELLKRLSEKLADAEGAKARAEALQTDRDAMYRRVFDAILSEEQVLNDLYAPIKARLAGAEGTLRKLAFSVMRKADVTSWAQRGESELVDLRRTGPFKGKGTLQQIADESLRPAWESGDAAAVAAAMATFRQQFVSDLIAHARVGKTDQAEYRAWLKRFAQWLYSTDHITIAYSVDYDGLDIRKLSPGTRGIVLLLLYLALDDADDRPLIIDQPEENLDPKSIYDELVKLFIAAKAKRQVIMVTHNANLVVNTDADQIIVAMSGPHRPDQLPEITYTSGGLENPTIRKHVCDILEGGETAFRERAKRLRVRF